MNRFNDIVKSLDNKYLGKGNVRKTKTEEKWKTKIEYSDGKYVAMVVLSKQKRDNRIVYTEVQLWYGIY